MLTFNRNYFFLALALFIIEVLIALYMHDRIVRPYVGDYLVVILMYCAVRAVLRVRPIILGIAVLVFAYAIEIGQYYHLVDRLGLGGNRLAQVVIGYGFEWTDLLAYTLGVATVLLLERRFMQKTAR